MTTTAPDPNRILWEAVAHYEETEWEALGSDPDGIDVERADDPRRALAAPA